MSETDMRHPDSVIQLASTVHRMKAPKVAKNDPQNPSSDPNTSSFVKSFRTIGQHPKTNGAILRADENRERLAFALDASVISGERIVENAKRYLPLINQILLSCKVQPEVARLDVPLEFAWISGLENENQVYSSNAMMYDLVMALVSEGLGHAALANEAADVQDYMGASRQYIAAAGIFHSLAQTHLPEWTDKCTTNTGDDALPVECSISVAEALAQLFKASAQQMAIAGVLSKPDAPNYGLLAKLSWGVADEMEKCLSKLRAKSFHLMSRMDADIFAAMNFQIGFQKALSMYLQARNQWDNKAEHGIAIALLKRSWTELKAIGKANSPAVDKATVTDFRQHIEKLLASYETENGTIYFATVPTTAIALQKFEEGVLMGKMQEYVMETNDPLPLILPPEPEVTAPRRNAGGGMFRRIAKIAGRT